jgi:prevent-host-death family protein
MNTVGLFEAKTKFSEICDAVAAQGVAVVVTRRGRPLVRIEPIPNPGGETKGVWDDRAAYVKANGPLTADFHLPPRQKQTWRDPLADG